MAKLTNGRRTIWAALYAVSMRTAAENGVIGVEAAHGAVHDAERGLDALEDFVATGKFPIPKRVLDILNG